MKKEITKYPRNRIFIKYLIKFFMYLGVICVAFLIAKGNMPILNKLEYHLLWVGGIMMGIFGVVSMYIADRQEFWKDMWIPEKKKKDKNKKD